MRVPRSAGTGAPAGKEADTVAGVVDVDVVVDVAAVVDVVRDASAPVV
jgi:hypothetical protein